MKYLKNIKNFLLESKSLSLPMRELRLSYDRFEYRLDDIKTERIPKLKSKVKELGKLGFDEDNDYEKLKSELDSYLGYTDENFEKIMEILKRDCSKFLNEMKETNSIIFRGYSGKIDYYKKIKGLIKKKRRTDRRPLDTPSLISDKIDNMFKDKFGIPLRSGGIFTTKNPSTAYSYSSRTSKIETHYSKNNPEVFMFFPIGDYDYYWNPNIEDLYDKIETWIPFPKGKSKLRRDYLSTCDGDSYFRGVVNNYQKGNLGKIDNQEITFISDKYYMVSEGYFYRLIDRLKIDPSN